MPHLAMDYSAGLEHRCDMTAVATAAHGAMVAAGIFPVAGIRVRLHKADHAIIADGLAENDFLAMTLSVGAGRSTEALKAAGDLIFAAVQTALAEPLATPHFALSLEIRIIDPELSWKDTPIHARVSAPKKD
ncbi:5-carboxymethyl-2-hydroxymuconate Delta-isomerase [Chachezhania antarctica]|uniref:5-carboxymethyl-2-hydroxymuconate Delta-isomerase n=1 Tax=Chachezhania antarctica TaxID=2340860 RepID=UPI000EB01812|nr:5-carboxymethyl-2-hydroxymuconate Delta-isomerase [Chachezhania antarctica]|tara:strand:+ start:5318 stop:5713 length:396 start_codon:yes stop_codon:yes gene_type:complete